MNTTLKTTGLSVKASALVVAALSALSMQAHAGDEASYRRIVLGQSTLSQPAAPEVQTASKVVPGSYARYLITVNGKSESQAIAQARQAGEQPTVQAAAPVARPVATSSHERYLRLLGQSSLTKSGT